MQSANTIDVAFSRNNKKFADIAGNTNQSAVANMLENLNSELGGNDAAFTLEETIPDIVNTIKTSRTHPGLQFLDCFGAVVPW